MTPTRVGCRLLALVGVALVLLIGLGQALHDGSEVRIGSDARLAVWVAVEAVATLLYFAAVARILRAPAMALWWVLAVAVAMRAIPLLSPMFLSSDLFRYIWDGRVQLAGINPYLYVPADPALAHLRDPDIYRLVNRAAYAHTIYPPMAEAVFAVAAWLGQTPVVMRAAMVGFEALGVAALLLVLRRIGAPPERLLIYAWNPLAVWEFAGNGHVDALAVGFLGLALLAVAHRRPGWTGVALAAAVLVKFLPAVVAPALWRRWDWRLPAAALLTAALLYSLYAGAGAHLLGFLPGYADEEGLRDGSGVWLLAGLASLGKLPAWAGAAFAGVLLAALAGLGWASAAREGWPDPVRAAGGAARLIVIALVGLSPHYPWYFPWACVPAVVSPQRGAIWLGAAPLLLYLDPLHEHFLWPALVYLPALALTLLDAFRPLPRPRGAAAPWTMLASPPAQAGDR